MIMCSAPTQIGVEPRASGCRRKRLGYGAQKISRRILNDPSECDPTRRYKVQFGEGEILGIPVRSRLCSIQEGRWTNASILYEMPSQNG